MLTLTKEIFLQIKRKEFYVMESKKWASANDSTIEYFDRFIKSCSQQIELLLPQWEAEFPPQVWYQASQGNVYAEDDEIYLDLQVAIDSVLEDADYDDIVIIWANELNTMPYPELIIFDKKIFSQPLVATG